MLLNYEEETLNETSQHSNSKNSNSIKDVNCESERLLFEKNSKYTRLNKYSDCCRSKWIWFGRITCSDRLVLFLTFWYGFFLSIRQFWVFILRCFFIPILYAYFARRCRSSPKTWISKECNSDTFDSHMRKHQLHTTTASIESCLVWSRYNLNPVVLVQRSTEIEAKLCVCYHLCVFFLKNKKFNELK